MDHIDRKILDLIQEDGRITMIDLSKKLHLSRPSVNERLRRLQNSGVIQGFPDPFRDLVKCFIDSAETIEAYTLRLRMAAFKS